MNNPSASIIGLTCRACLQPSNPSIPIFIKIQNSDVSVADMLEFCSLEVKKDENFPGTICMSCMSSLQTCYNFVKNYKNSALFFDQHLDEIMKVKEKEKKGKSQVIHIHNTTESEDLVIPMELGDHDYSIVIIEEDEENASVNKRPRDFSYECPNCAQIYDKFVDFNRHMHEYLGDVQCKLCPESTNSYNYASHFKKNHKFKCQTCSERFSDNKILKEHLKCHQIKSEDVEKTHNKHFDCPVCDIKLSKIYSLYSHIESFHNNINECPLCNESQIEGLYLDHFKDNHMIKCKWCPRLFHQAHEELINEHLKRHQKPEDMFELDQSTLEEGTPDFIHTCPICEDIGFTSIDSLSEHLEHLHSEEKVTCLLCQIDFKDFSQFIRHYKTLHTLKEGGGGYKDHFCPTCSENFEEFHQFSLHLAKHLDLISCHLCPGTFTSDCYLDHYSKVHRYQCPLCMKTFTQKYPYDRHIDSHLNKYFVCKIEGCGKTFGAKNSLRQHLLNIHNEEKNFLCNECGMAFKSTDGLRYHLKKHQERRFLCTYCGKRFIQNAHLTYHLWRHTGKKPYNCEECGKSCVSKKLLMRHLESGYCLKIRTEEIYLKNEYGETSSS